MSKYTIEVRWIVENLAGDYDSDIKDGTTSWGKLNDLVEKCWNKIFDQNWKFPIFDEQYRSVICCKILTHFMFREIGFETIGLWTYKLNQRMNEIMPYYNKLYQSANLEFDPLHDVDVTTTHKGSGSNTGTVANEATGKTDHTSKEGYTTARRVADTKDDYSVFSDLPQGGLEGVRDGTYLTNARRDTANDNSSTTGEDTTDTVETTENKGNNTETRNLSNTDEYVETVVGKRGASSTSSLIKEYRQTLINVDEMIFDELNDLFIQLW